MPATFNHSFINMPVQEAFHNLIIHYVNLYCCHTTKVKNHTTCTALGKFIVLPHIEYGYGVPEQYVKRPIGKKLTVWLHFISKTEKKTVHYKICRNKVIKVSVSFKYRTVFKVSVPVSYCFISNGLHLYLLYISKFMHFTCNTGL